MFIMHQFFLEFRRVMRSITYVKSIITKWIVKHLATYHPLAVIYVEGSQMIYNIKLVNLFSHFYNLLCNLFCTFLNLNSHFNSFVNVH